MKNHKLDCQCCICKAIRKETVGKNNSNYKFIPKKFLIQEYIKSNKSIREIAQLLNFGQGLIRRRMKEYSIPIRDRSKCQLGVRRNKGELSHSYIDGRTLKKHYCLDCDKKVTYYKSKRCKSCENKRRYLLGVMDSKGKNNIMFGKRGENSPNFGNKYPEQSKRMSGRNNPNYGKPPSHGKGAYYKGIYMRSSYEINFANLLDLSGLKYKYEPKAFDLGDTTYTPDFYIQEWNLYIEIKGWWRDYAKKKFSLFKKLYPKENIKVLMKPDLEKIGAL